MTERYFKRHRPFVFIRRIFFAA